MTHKQIAYVLIIVLKVLIILVNRTLTQCTDVHDRVLDDIKEALDLLSWVKKD